MPDSKTHTIASSQEPHRVYGFLLPRDLGSIVTLMKWYTLEDIIVWMKSSTVEYGWLWATVEVTAVFITEGSDEHGVVLQLFRGNPEKIPSCRATCKRLENLNKMAFKSGLQKPLEWYTPVTHSEKHLVPPPYDQHLENTAVFDFKYSV
ncbi:hypothetical protein CVT25_001867 [Psilocybe cyanescens]|uniref:Uncharacterized protein n=1 Tax=Psilocybe cyanescens TaxID=93625 RepID=A0A409WQH2_PSICY|nr:hypothetical protein CVT25_001867 [Psilocybe cyanescens]